MNDEFQDKSKDTVVLPELNQFNYPLEVKTEITVLYGKVSKGKIKRGSPRRGYIYCCIIAVCKQRNIALDKTKIQNLLDLKQHDINKAIKEVESAIGRIISLNIVDSIKSILNILGIKEDCLPEILEIYEKCRKLSSRFNSSRVETLANALVFFYLKNKLPDFNEDFYFEKSKISKDTIVDISEEIAKWIKIE
jgi:transcription initiation factor TFIIIB Brf1 subunit/transcription initiation factor TFIIB